ncbi:hypothetical protein K8R78_09020 [bacterium]|nr:hypothetical protein [bacterium]
MKKLLPFLLFAVLLLSACNEVEVPESFTLILGSGGGYSRVAYVRYTITAGDGDTVPWHYEYEMIDGTGNSYDSKMSIEEAKALYIVLLENDFETLENVSADFITDLTTETVTLKSGELNHSFRAYGSGLLPDKRHSNIIRAIFDSCPVPEDYLPF